MTFQEWLTQTEEGRMVSFEELPRMLEIAYKSGAGSAEARAAQLEEELNQLHRTAQADEYPAAHQRDIITLRERAAQLEAERDELREKLEQAQLENEELNILIWSANEKIDRQKELLDLEGIETA